MCVLYSDTTKKVKHGVNCARADNDRETLYTARALFTAKQQLHVRSRTGVPTRTVQIKTNVRPICMIIIIF